MNLSMRLELSIGILCVIISQWQSVSLANCDGLSVLLPGSSNIGGDDLKEERSSRHVVERLYLYDMKQLEEISNDLSAQLKTMASNWDQTLDDTNVGQLGEDPDKDGDRYPLIGDDDLPKLSFFERSKEFVRRSIAPAREYVGLVKRYRAWYRDYNQLIESFCDQQENPGECKDHPPVRSALDAIQIEYAKVDQKLFEEASNCRRQLRRNPKHTLILNEPKRDLDDFLLKALRLLIDRLEDNLNNIKLNGFLNENNEIDEMLLKMSKEEQDQYTRMAIERAKRMAQRKAKRVALREIRHLFKFVLLNSLANQVKNRDRSMEGPNDVMNYLEPIILLLGDVNTPVIVSYLRDLRFRLALTLVNQLTSVKLCPLLGRD